MFTVETFARLNMTEVNLKENWR